MSFSFSFAVLFIYAVMYETFVDKSRFIFYPVVVPNYDSMCCDTLAL